MGKFIKFDHVNALGNFPAVLNNYGLEYTQKGGSIRMLCPFHEDTDPSLSITLEETDDAKPNTWHCFGCKESGSIIDFVALLEGNDDPRAAAEFVATISDCGLAPPKSSGRRRAREADRSPKPPRAASTASEGVSDGDPPEKAGKAPSGAFEEASRVNPPLKFELKTVLEHPYLSERVPPETAEHFELGYVPGDSRSMFSGRVVIPLHDFKGNLIGYQGRIASDPVPNGVEKYLLPPKLDKMHVLYNAHRLPKTPDVVIVEAAFAAMRLHMLGAPVVALLGTAVSQSHVEQLCLLGVRRVLLLFDGDHPGQSAIPAALDKLARSFFVTVGELPNGLDPDDVDEDLLHQFATVFG